MKEIEDTIFDNEMAVNCIVAANRLVEIMQENKTNCLKGVEDLRIRRTMWFLNSYVFGQMTTISMASEWEELYQQYKQER